jgi:hypothetical protein
MSPELDALEVARLAVRSHREELFRLPNVIGSGVSTRVVGGRRTDELCALVYVQHKVPLNALREEERIPRELNTVQGRVPTDVIATPVPTLCQLPDLGPYRPIRGGCALSIAGRPLPERNSADWTSAR